VAPTRPAAPAQAEHGGDPAEHSALTLRAAAAGTAMACPPCAVPGLAALDGKDGAPPHLAREVLSGRGPGLEGLRCRRPHGLHAPDGGLGGVLPRVELGQGRGDVVDGELAAADGLDDDGLIALRGRGGAGAEARSDSVACCVDCARALGQCARQEETAAGGRAARGRSGRSPGSAWPPSGRRPRS